MAKTLYMCQVSSGYLAYTYAEDIEEAKAYFEELLLQFRPGWFGGEYSVWHCPDGWFLAGTEEYYKTISGQDLSIFHEKVSIVPFSLARVKAQLHRFRELREQKQREREEMARQEQEKQADHESQEDE
ncbi:MAG: hypothetical protein J2P37_30975 [Ktedonobacteraceae bacterium]|nr:hypothetical protein [Ktedonobacteraceae bacterium]